MLDVLWGKKISRSSIQNAQVSSAVEEEGRLTFRNAVAVLAVIFCLYTNHTTAATDDIIAFNIPQQRADLALTEFAEQANLTLVFPFDQVKDKTANRLVGHYPIEFAVTQLLQGTGLTPTFSNRLVLNIAIESKGKRMNIKNMNLRKTLLATSVGIFAAGAGSSGVMAQETTGSEEMEWLLEEVVVTANRREEKLQDVAMAVTAVDPVEFTSVGLVSLKEVLTYTPGFSSSNTSGRPNVGLLAVRGVAPDPTGKGTVTVATYLDGVALSSSAPFGGGSGSSFDGLLGDIERVEFLKGPQGTLYGAGAVGGTIKYVTRKPSLEKFSGVMAVDGASITDGGNTGLYNARITTPLLENKLGLTLAGFYEESDGFTDRVDAVTGQLIKEDTNSYDRYGLSADLYLEVSDQLNFRVRALHQQTNGDSFTRETLLLGTTDPLNAPLGNQEEPTESGYELSVYSGSVEYQFEDMTLTSTTAYLESEASALGSAYSPGFAAFADGSWIGSGFPATTDMPAVQKQGYDRFTQELQLASDGDGDWEWITGLYYADEENADLLVITAAPSGFILLSNDNIAEYTELAAFGNITYNVSPDFDVTLGARLSRNEITNTPNANANAPLNTYDISFTESVKDTVATYSLAMRYRPNDNLSFYSRVASGYRPGTVDVSTSGVASEVDSDSLWSYEVGAKGELAEGLVSYDVAVYYFDWDNFQAVLPGFGSALFTNADGGITGKGLEASMTLRPFDGLSIITNMAYNSSELNADEPGLYGLKGQQTPKVPEWSASSRIRYDFSLASGQEAYVGLGVRYEDSARSAYANGFGTLNNVPSDSYVIADLNAGVTFNTITLGLYATNLSDERAIQSIVSDASQRGVPIKPRTVGVRLSVNF